DINQRLGRIAVIARRCGAIERCQSQHFDADLVDCIAGTIVKDNEEDRARLRRYFEQRVATHKEAHWQAYYQARHRLP
ncbi:hypothetical protein ACUOFC_19005, partial [Escherichia sp. TWPC-MK]